MPNRRYQEVQSRHMVPLFPPGLDDDVAAETPVRALDASVDMLDLRALGFCRAMWLCQKARPSSKTIAAFRKNNAKALKRVPCDFVSDCREFSLVGGRRVAVDGSFLKASAHRGRVPTKDSLARGCARLDKLIESHDRAMDEADATEPEARLLRKSVVGYKGQITVDDKAKLIVATDVVLDGNDSHQLEPIMTKASEAVGNEGLVELTDAGYASGDPLKGCEDKGMEKYVPRPDTTVRKGKDGLFGREDFRYDKATDS